jgi:hypothetical protein
MARCPNCTETLHRGAGGDYPPQCPKCGVRIRAKSKSTTAAAKPPSPAPVEERVVRSFSTRRQSAPVAPLPEHPFASPPVVEETFAESDQETLNATPFSEPAALPAIDGANPFVPPEEAKKEAHSRPAEPINPFGASEVAGPKVKTPKTGLVKGIVAGVLSAAILGVGGWYGRDLFSKPISKDRPGFHNPGRNYVFYALPAPWKTDEKRAHIAGFELVLRRDDLRGWVTIRSELMKEESLDPKEVAEQVAARWKDRITDFKPSEQLAKMELANHDAIVVEGEGTLDGKPVRGRTLVLAAGGVKYLLSFEGPLDEWDQLERDFALARENFELTGASVAPVKVLGENEVAVFESKKFPYRLTVPAGKWREVPDLQTDSRFDDLKLQDKARLGEVVVTVRETKDLPGMRVRYVERQSRLYENKVRELEGSIEKLAIRGKPAMRTILIVSNAGGDFMLHTTFVQGDGLIFQIQCRAPVDKRDVYEPIFVKITDSFEILDRPPTKEPSVDEAPKKPGTEKTAPPAEGKTESEPMKATPPPEKKELVAEKKPTPEKKPAEGEKKKETEPKKSGEGEKKPDAPKKKKSLDDLD